ncbi:transglutaminase family protein [Allorhizobium borbori]|uniref:Transglutaminase-like putative cysteine protease n=1 Tax=Allorhizobium borbori TaxID=485907 RepID=A0A7W6K1Y9_9HYPH|nr:transglutaminase family protein [Allorhizobium borbori]MBB4103676.1 transglutaminase-like putative cysteine protease [Allorhizobium borbori]
MTIFSVRHITSYRYRRPVLFGQHRLMFRPRDSFDQTQLDCRLDVHPTPKAVRWVHDVFGNCIALIDFADPEAELSFETSIRLDHTAHVPLDLETDMAALTFPFAYEPDEAIDLERTIERHYPDPGDEVGKWARQFVPVGPQARTGHVLMTLCFAIHDGFSYVRRSEHGTQPPVETLRLRKGSCRDFALLMMEATRSLGLAARFVTGYIYVQDRDGSVTIGGGSTHAWCQVYIPGAGWVEFDPTNGIVGNRDLIRVGVARDPRQAIPLSGSYDGGADDFDSMLVQVNVTTGTSETAVATPA